MLAGFVHLNKRQTVDFFSIPTWNIQMKYIQISTYIQLEVV